MTEHTYEDAVQTLRARLGARWEGSEADGRDEILDLLEDELGYSRADARAVFEAMVASGTLRYHPAAESADGAPSAVALGAPATTGGVMLPAVPLGGYWQIGSGAEPAEGRKGQVQPS